MATDLSIFDPSKPNYIGRPAAGQSWGVPGAHLFNGGTFDQQNAQLSDFYSLMKSGQYRDIPGSIIQSVLSGRMTIEDGIAAIKGTPVFNVNAGPVVNGVPTGPGGVQPNPGLGTGFTVPGGGSVTTTPGAAAATGLTPPNTGATPTAPAAPPEIGAPGSVAPSSGPMGAPSQTYTVQPGDTISKIAAQHGVKPSSISGYASGNPNLIRPGEKLTIGGSAPLITGGGQGGGSAAPSGAPPGSPAATPAGGATLPPATGAPGSNPLSDYVTSLLKQWGVSAPAATQDPINAYADAYSQLAQKMGLADIKTQYSTYQKQFTDLQNQKIDDTNKINEDPWLTEGERVGRLQQLDTKYDLKLNTLTSQMTLFKGMYDSGQQEAQFVASQAMTISHQNTQFTQDMIMKAIDIATAATQPFNLGAGATRFKYNAQTGQFEAVASGGDVTTSTQRIYDADGNLVGTVSVKGSTPGGGAASGSSSTAGQLYSATHPQGGSPGSPPSSTPNTAISWYNSMQKDVSSNPPDPSFGNTPIAAIGNRTPNSVYQTALGIAFKDDKVQAAVGGLSTNTKTASGRADVSFKRIVTNVASAIGAKYGSLPSLQALYKSDAAAATQTVERLARVDSVANAMVLNIPRLMQLSDQVKKSGVQLQESDLQAGQAAIQRKFGNTAAASYIELIQTLRSDYAAMQSGLAGSRGGQFFAANAADAIPIGLSSDQYKAIGDTIQLSATNASHAINGEVATLLNQAVGGGVQNTRNVGGKTYAKGADGLWYPQ